MSLTQDLKDILNGQALTKVEADLASVKAQLETHLKSDYLATKARLEGTVEHLEAEVKRLEGEISAPVLSLMRKLGLGPTAAVAKANEPAPEAAPPAAEPAPASTPPAT